MEALKQVEHLVSTKLSVIKAVLSLMQLEARLAGLSVFPLLLNLCMLLIVLMTFWLSICILIGYEFLLAFNSFPLALFLVFTLNLGVLWGLAKYLTFNIKNMSFEKTRSYIFQNKDMDDECEKTINRANCSDGQDDTPTTNAGEGT
jgi:hypothetical protein